MVYLSRLGRQIDPFSNEGICQYLLMCGIMYTVVRHNEGHIRVPMTMHARNIPEGSIEARAAA
jgi:hypothetical protein